MPLAPNRNNSALSQESPSSSFIRASQSSDCFAVRMPPAGLKPTAIPVSCAYSRMARVMTRLTGSVALTVSLPVDVFMKSAPAIIATTLARATLRSVSKSPVPRITFRCAGPQAFLNAAVSSYSACHLPPKTCARDDHVDFVGAGFNRPANFRHAFLEGRKTGRESRGDGGNMNAAALDRAPRGFDE